MTWAVPLIVKSWLALLPLMARWLAPKPWMVRFTPIVSGPRLERDRLALQAAGEVDGFAAGGGVDGGTEATLGRCHCCS